MSEEELKRQYEEEKALHDKYTAEKVAFESSKPVEAAATSEQFSPDFVPGMPTTNQLVGTLAGLDVLESPVRAGVSEFAKGPYIKGNTAEKLKLVGKSLGAASQQFGKNIQEPMTAPRQAPSYEEIINRELRTNVIPNVLTSEKEKGAISGTGGLALEAAMPSVSYGLGKSVTSIPSIGGKITDFLSKSKSALKNVERNQLAKVMAKFETQAQFANSKIDPDQVAAHLVDAEVTKHAANPDKMLEALTGEKVTKYEEVAPGLSKEVKGFGEGIIARKSKAMKSEVVDIANKAGVETQVPAFALRNKLKQKSLMQDPLSGRRFSPEDIDQRSKIIDEVLKPLEEEIVPGIPMEAFRPPPKEVLPPVVPLESPDLLPMSQMEAGVPPVFLPKEPVAPQSYAGIASKEALAKYDSAISDWESEVAKLQKEHQAELASGRKYDETVMDTKIKQAADRFTEKAKRNKAYNKEIIEADAEWQQHLEDAMKKKVFNKPRHWSLQDMMELRTNIGKRLSSAEFHSDKPLTMEKEVLEEIYHNLREEITVISSLKLW